MKKTLAIVLALVMVLAMIPAMSAHVTEYKTITDKSYTLAIHAVGGDAVTDANNGFTSLGNSVTLKYDWNDIKADETGRYTEDVAMANVHVLGWDDEFAGETTSVTVDGKVLTAGMTADTVIFPVELTKAGYTDTFVITATKTVGDKQITETAKVTIKLVNTGLDLKEKTAVVTNIASKTDDVAAYIVGDKIYLDYVATKDLPKAKIWVTFADENGKAFTGKVWAIKTKSAEGQIYTVDGEAILDKSGALYAVYAPAAAGTIDTKVQFVLDPAEDVKYLTKKYSIVVRTGIVETDPKGIYFAETTKTIAMGESYTPVVVGVATGKPVAATITYGDNTSKEVIDVENGETVIGTREGVAYITASYKAAGQKTTYTASSMKIVVTLPGESIPEVEAEAKIYYVTCRALNVRAGAGTSYKKVDLIHRGDAVKVVELKNGWAKLDDGTYVCAKYIAK